MESNFEVGAVEIMEIGNLWLIPFSIFLNSSLYWVQKHYLIKWFCRRFLTDSVQLECDLKNNQKESSISNGNAAGLSNGHVKDAKESSHSATDYSGKKLVTDGEINGIAME